MALYEFKPEDARRFAKERGIRTREKGKELQFQYCPYCWSKKDQYKFSINLDTGAFNCVRASCGKKGNMITLAQEFGFSLGRDVDEYYGQPRRYRSLKKYPVPETKTAAVRYMESRGISRQTTEKYNITTRGNEEGIIAFPFYDENDDLQFVKYRNTAPKENQSKEWCLSNCKPILFGMNQCNPENKTLVLTEGQIDSLTCAECGIENAVSVPTGAKGFTWVPYCWDFLRQYDTLIVFGDHEKGKITLLDEMRLRFNGTVKHVRPFDYLDCKDANELLQKHGKQAVIDAVMHAEPVRNPKIKRLADVKKVDLANLEKINTGLVALDNTLGGLYFGQLILLTGERGQGKSTLGSQIVTKAIEKGHTVFCYSGELQDWMFRDWIDRQIAGPSHVITTRQDNGYINYAVDENCMRNITDWYYDSCFLYDNGILIDSEDGTEEEALLDTLENAIKQYGCRVLLIDNLMTAMDDDTAADIYRQQTEFVKKLAKLSKHYNAIIILVAHPRKSNGFEFRNDDVAGSGNITNLVDVVLRYAIPKQEKDADPPKGDRILQVFKNRLTGKLITDGIPLWFDEKSKRITDTQGRFGWALGWEGTLDNRDVNSINDFVAVDDDYDTEIPF